MPYTVRFTPEAEQDLLQLYGFLADHDSAAAGRALAAIRKASSVLEAFPFACRRAEGSESPFLREMVITFGNAGYVLLFEIDSDQFVTVLAVRHQREDDFY